MFARRGFRGVLLQRGQGGGRTPGDGQLFSSTAVPTQGSGTPINFRGRAGQMVNPFAPDIASMRRVLVIQNPMAGWRTAADTFALHVSATMDKAGVVHKVRQVPPENLKAVLTEEARSSPRWDAVLLAGGDGTLNAYAYLMTVPQFAATWAERPVVVLPVGANNGVAASLAIHDTTSTNASIISGRERRVPIFLVTLHQPGDAPGSPGAPVSAALGGVSIGMFADTLVSARSLLEYMQGFVTLPTPRRRNLIAALYQIATMSDASVVPIAVRYTEPGSSVNAVNPGAAMKALPVGVGLTMLVASQMRYHHRGYSLTPDAAFGQPWVGPVRPEVTPRLTVTTASADVSRSRMLHLMLKEAGAAKLEYEDGIETFEAETLEIGLGRAPGAAPSDSGKRAYLIDGEECELLPGQTLRVAWTGKYLTMMTP
jgi:diacylglycerol kinase family enzyme